MPNYQKTKRACYMGFITQAIAANFAPLLFLKFHTDYHISLGNIALISTCFFFTQLLVDLFCARFVDKIGYRVCIVTSEISSALGLVGLAFLPELLPDPFMGIIISVIVYAVGSGLIEVLMFSINPCYDLQPPTENVDDLWADENYAHSLQNIDPERERLYELCEEKGVGLDVMKVYGGGDLLSETNSPFGKAMTPVQCIEYALTRPAVASIMVGCRSCDEMQAAIDWCTASKEERDYTAVMAGMEKFTWKGHCMYCGHCAPCSVGIDIASVNKYYNLTIAQNEIPETVREHYKALTHHASECIQCGQCETNCPFGVAIIEQMEKAAEKFGY